MINEIGKIVDILIPEETPVSFEEFVKSEEYCNSSEMYDFWITEFSKLNDPQELLLDGSLGTGKCQSGDTLVLTGDGVRKLESLVSTRVPDTSNSTEESVFVEGREEKLSECYYSGKKPTKIIKLSDGTELECSFHHRYKVWRCPKFEWVKAEDLQEGDLLKVDLTPSKVKKPTSYSDITFEVCRKRDHSTYTMRVDEDFGYFLGLMAGDGTYSSEVAFLSTDPQLYNWVLNYLKVDMAEDCRRTQLKIMRFQWLKPLFEKLGIYGQNSETKLVPEIIYNASLSIQIAYLQGLMDTDGTCCESEVGIDLNTKPVLHFAKAVANAMGIHSWFQKPRGKSYRLRFDKSANLEGLFRLKRKIEVCPEAKRTDYARGATHIILPGLLDYLNDKKKELNLKYTRKEHKLSCRNEVSINTWRHKRNFYLERGIGSEVELGDPNVFVSKVISIEEGEAELYDLTNPISESYRANGIVSHNTTVANYYILYRLYKLFLKPNLHKELGISKNSPIYVLYFSVSLTQARLSGFQHLINLVDDNAWFTKYFPRDKRVDSAINFPNNFSIRYASSEGHQISLNVVGFILDEANFRKGVGLGLSSEYIEVANLYQQLIDRQITRFARPEGSNAFAILISSASYQSSFVAKRKAIIEGIKEAACITSVSYKVKPWNYSKETFEVFIGTGTINPQMVTSPSHKMSLIRQLDMVGMEYKYKDFFIDVPESIKLSYQTNCSLALQNHSGIPTQIEGRFIQNMDIVRNASYIPEKNWFPQSQVTLSNQDDFELQDIIDLSQIEYPERPHAFFFDLSVSGDSGGFSCYRNDSISDTEKFCTHVFTLEIIPPGRPAETRLTKITNFIIFIYDYINLEVVASDQYASKTMRQEINAILGLDDLRFSIDSSDEFHLHWLKSLVNERANVIPVPKLMTECAEAIHNLKTRRVVRSENSTDDLFQSVVGAHFACSVYTQNDQINLNDMRRNIVGANAVKRMLKYLDYN